MRQLHADVLTSYIYVCLRCLHRGAFLLVANHKMAEAGASDSHRLKLSLCLRLPFAFSAAGTRYIIPALLVNLAL